MCCYFSLALAGKPAVLGLMMFSADVQRGNIQGRPVIFDAEQKLAEASPNPGLSEFITCSPKPDKTISYDFIVIC